MKILSLLSVLLILLSKHAEAQELTPSLHAEGAKYRGWAIGPIFHYSQGEVFGGGNVGFVREIQKAGSMVNRFDLQYGLSQDASRESSPFSSSSRGLDHSLSAAVAGVSYYPSAAAARGRFGLGIGVIGTYGYGALKQRASFFASKAHRASIALAPSLHYEVIMSGTARFGIMLRYEAVGLRVAGAGNNSYSSFDGVQFFPKAGVSGGLQLSLQFLGLVAAK